MTSNADTICDQMSEEPEIIELIDDSDEIKDNITQESLPNYMHADTSQNDYINCIQLDDCDDDGIIKSDIDLKQTTDCSQNLILEEFRPAQSFDNLIKSEIINNQQQNYSKVISSFNKTDNNLEINNQIKLEKPNINLASQQTDNNLNSSFNDSFTSINERVLHLESKLEINTDTNQQQLNNELELNNESNQELNTESNQELNNESNQELNNEHKKIMNLSLPNENAELNELGIIKIPGRKVPDCKYRTITLKILPPSQSTNQTTQPINSNLVINQTIKREQIVSPIKISTAKISPIKTINSTTKPTIQTINPIQRINLKNENQSEIKNEIKNDNQINLTTNKSNISSIKRPIDEVDKAILKINKKMCITAKCNNIAIESVDWDSEYCSSKCLIKNCEEIFKRYVERKKREREDNKIVV